MQLSTDIKVIHAFACFSRFKNVTMYVIYVILYGLKAACC